MSDELVLPARLDSKTDNRAAARQIAAAARRELCLFHFDLAPEIFDDAEFAGHLRRLATQSRRARIRILLWDSTRAVKDGHQVVRLAQQLTSFIEIRNPPRDYADIADAALIADGKAYLYRPLASRYEAQAALDDAPRARELQRRFEEMWQLAEPDPEFRRLGL